METRSSLIVKAIWDPEVSVWCASSDDIPGLATEAPTLDLLVAKLKVLIPELLEANGSNGPDDEIPFELISTLTSVAYRQVA